MSLVAFAAVSLFPEMTILKSIQFLLKDYRVVLMNGKSQKPMCVFPASATTP